MTSITFPLAVALAMTFVLRASAQQAPPESVFETPPIIRASEILSPALLKSPHHSVGEKVTTQGYANSYLLTTKAGSTGVSGTSFLVMRIREAAAIDEISKIKGTKQFASAVKEAAKSPLVGAKSLITEPLQTLGNIPKGAKRILGRANENIREGREKSEYEEGTLKSMIGFSKTKRQLAYDLKVDPYSSNKQLQDELDSLAWAGFAGGVGVNVGLGMVSGGGTALVAVKGLKTADSFAQMIRDSNPADLQKINREKLAAMQIPESVYRPFIDNKWYSPTTEAAVVHILERLSPAIGRENFVKAAATATTEFEAQFYMQTARLMALYHQNVGQIAGITDLYGIPVGYDKIGTLIVPLHWDFAAWTSQVATAVGGMQTFQLSGGAPTGVHIYMSGNMSSRAREEIASRQIQLTENAFGR